MRINRRRFIQSILLAAPATAGYARFVEPAWLDVSNVTVPIDRTRLSRPIRILHLSDFHVSKVVPLGRVQQAIRLGLAEKPDIACVTGDFITAHDPTGLDYSEALKVLSSQVPTFAVLGNHDGGIWAQRRGGYGDSTRVTNMIREAGIQLMINTCASLSSLGWNITLVGLGDYWSRFMHPERAFTSVDSASCRIVLSHNPDSKKELARYEWELMLSGHTHGGQVVFPLIGAPYAPVEDTRFISGLYPWNDRQLYITRGVGNLHGVRFACRPEVSVLNLVPA